MPTPRTRGKELSDGRSNRSPIANQKSKIKNLNLLASGDLRASANQKCWPAQAAMEAALAKALKAEGCAVARAHPL